MQITNQLVENNFEQLEPEKLYALKPTEIKPTGFEGRPYTGINTDIPVNAKKANFLQILYLDTNPDNAKEMSAAKRSTLVLPVVDTDKPVLKAYIFKGFISAYDCRRWYRNKFKQPDDTPGYTPPEKKG